MFDACVVGSGPGGVFAGRGLRGLNVLMLDAGLTPPPGEGIGENLYELRQRNADLTRELLGEDLIGLRHFFHDPVSLKLKSPRTAYVIEAAERLTPVISGSFRATLSLAEGGLANAWGAGVYRFNRHDLAGVPLTPEVLAPYYDEIGAHIGISGAGDDLAEDFGHEPCLQPPLRLSRNLAALYARYEERKDLFRRAGIRIGRSRLAALTEPHGDRTPYAYRNVDLFETRDPAIYNPAYSLREMTRAGEVTYEPGWIVTRFVETETGVTVHARRTDGSSSQSFEARSLLLAAGAINSARIVLASRDDHHSELPLLDNPISVFPLLHLNAIGGALAIDDPALAQLNIVAADSPGGRVFQGSLYSSSGPLRSDMIGSIPLPCATAIDFGRLFAPALSLLMLFYPETARPGNYIRLRPDGALEAAYHWMPDRQLESRLARWWRRLGVLSIAALNQHPKPGGGLHYAGTLPMRAEPKPYETWPDGRLQGTRRVYVCDGSVFPWLPAKNLTYTLMAIALRTARLLRKDLG